MSKTLANLRVGVRVYLDEAQQTDFLDTEVDREINYAYQDVVGSVMEVYEDFYNTVTPKTYSTVANQQEYTLDTTLLKIRRVEVNFKPSDSNSVAARCIPFDIDEVPSRLGDSSTGGSGLYNAGYYINGKQSNQKLGLLPVPTEAGVNAISVWGLEAPADMSSSSDTADIPYPDRFGKLIELKAAAELLRKGQQEVQAAADLEARYDRGLLEMKTFIKERKADGVDMIEDVLMEDIQFDYQL